MSWVLTILYTVVMIMVLVMIHEFGHFIVGYKSGIKINEFSIGFGPKIFSKVKKDIRYSIRCLPVGGFVQFHGEDEDMPNDPLAFNNAPLWKRFFTILAGPMMNIILAIIIAVVALSCYGDLNVAINEVNPGSPAEEAGIMEDDIIVGINGSRIDFYSEYYTRRDEISSSDTVELTLLRGDEKIDVTVHPREEEGGQRLIGVTLRFDRKTFNFGEAFILSFKWIFMFTVQMLQVIFESLKNLDTSQLSGIVGMTQTVNQTVEAGGGLENLLRMASLLSLNLGIFNLLPFPALDGGRLVFIIIEKIRRKPVSRKVEGCVNFVGLMLLFALMILLVFQDVGRIIG